MNPEEIIEVKEDAVATLEVTYAGLTIDQFKIVSFRMMPGQIVFITEDGQLKGLSLYGYVTTWSIRIEDIKISDS